MIVLDASALLAFVQREPGGLKVKAELHNCAISAVNFTEVLNRLQKTLGPQDVAVAGAHLPTLLREIVAYTGDDAHATSSVYAVTRNLGLSLGDCVCLALGKKTERPRLDLRPQLGEPRCQLSRQRYQIANSARDESAMLAYQAGAEQVMFESAENQSDM